MAAATRSSSKKKNRPVVKVQGTLQCEVVRRGTASEHEALVLDCGSKGRLVLSRLGGNPFEVPPETAQWLGRRVMAEGYLLESSELRYLKLQPLAK